MEAKNNSSFIITKTSVSFKAVKSVDVLRGLQKVLRDIANKKYSEKNQQRLGLYLDRVLFIYHSHRTIYICVFYCLYFDPFFKKRLHNACQDQRDLILVIKATYLSLGSFQFPSGGFLNRDSSVNELSLSIRCQIMLDLRFGT